MMTNIGVVRESSEVNKVRTLIDCADLESVYILLSYVIRVKIIRTMV